ncbi:FAD-dependent oxidoreductase [Cupriavidus necator]|uniref:FAD-dependent oxidoreductase n=1 Tax=Cupriavidus necator TaxID=106590 RepID=UPI0005B46CA1|nr:FAD-dependent oxidoreductase [Cupriavidus necator]
MLTNDSGLDALVIGGGFYGCTIAIYLNRHRGMGSIALIEQEASLMTRASYSNQARVHNGYHYPRSFTTAYRSRINLPHFVRDWPDAVKQDFTKLYAIARRNSKVNARQFERFCHQIGARIQLADTSLHSLFEPRLIESVFLVEEYAFDSTKLAAWGQGELKNCGIDVRFQTKVIDIVKARNGMLAVSLRHGNSEQTVLTRRIFNCTYSGLNRIGGDFPGTNASLKHEITEMALIKPPPALSKMGITVMDGPFFSIMPFPARDLHTFSHVRYTPHLSWEDQPSVDPYQRMDEYRHDTRVDRMVRDVARYLPAIQEAKYVDSLFEVKTVLVKNEVDDGRPILFEAHPNLPGCYSILGGKIDNIYDVLEKLDAETL